MKELRSNILQCIGNTSLVELRRVAPKNGARILLKVESENPTGSMKDRMALAMIETAEADGRLKPGGSVVEYTGGSTGVSLALVCAVKGHPLHIVSSDAFSHEKLDHMKILGARLQIVKSDSGRMTEKLTRDMIEAARVVAEQTEDLHYTSQSSNAYVRLLRLRSHSGSTGRGCVGASRRGAGIRRPATRCSKKMRMSVAARANRNQCISLWG
jgi:cysteine synthase